MIRTIFALCFVFAVASARITPVCQCSDSNSVGAITNFNIEPCDSDRCVFKPNTKVTITGELITNSTAENPIMFVEVESGRMFIEYPSLSENACKYIACPLKADAPNPFKIELVTLDWLPPMDTIMQLSIIESKWSNDDDSLACIEIEIDIDIIAA
ncbi:uncharacterized protein LOC107363421 [Tetranychus urticae]|uniref:MD-2-related lipid-recognition domain-containing protein n=1 Tax=Tetranychus urticae TaxID=32264 RepID=T1JQB4_TETUR|nr:uncharacterized protein LOC107363421 [Tetranychus urticae]